MAPRNLLIGIGAFLAMAWLVAIAVIIKGDGKRPVDESIAKMREFTDRMCDCADKRCADQITEEMSDWSREMAKRSRKPERLSELDTKRMAATTEELTKCMTKAMMPREQ
jgi:hypothetical protein